MALMEQFFFWKNFLLWRPCPLRTLGLFSLDETIETGIHGLRNVLICLTVGCFVKPDDPKGQFRRPDLIESLKSLGRFDETRLFRNHFFVGGIVSRNRGQPVFHTYAKLQ